MPTFFIFHPQANIPWVSDAYPALCQYLKRINDSSLQEDSGKNSQKNGSGSSWPGITPSLSNCDLRKLFMETSHALWDQANLSSNSRTSTYWLYDLEYVLNVWAAVLSALNRDQESYFKVVRMKYNKNL